MARWTSGEGAMKNAMLRRMKLGSLLGENCAMLRANHLACLDTARKLRCRRVNSLRMAATERCETQTHHHNSHRCRRRS